VAVLFILYCPLSEAVLFILYCPLSEIALFKGAQALLVLIRAALK
jgi:hypothetical protein